MEYLRSVFCVGMGVFLWVVILWTPAAYGQAAAPRVNLPEGVYIELTKDFYQALKNDGAGGTKVYSNDPSAEYLREISISTRFMVETNLQILKNQERILQLLQPRSEKVKK